MDAGAEVIGGWGTRWSAVTSVDAVTPDVVAKAVVAGSSAGADLNAVVNTSTPMTAARVRHTQPV